MAKGLLDPSNAGGETAKDLFVNYSEYNKTLRTWFVTFGVGGPALFLATPSLAQKLYAAGHLDTVIWYFLAGSGLQILIAIINKFAGWYEYRACRENKIFGGFWGWVSSLFWLDQILDVLTVASFGYAIWTLCSVFLQNP